MDAFNLHTVLLIIQRGISFCGVLVILIGVILALIRYFKYAVGDFNSQKVDINKIRLNLSLVLTLGLEFIVAADLIGTTTAPDFYSVGLVASIILIRTVLGYTLNRDISSIKKQEEANPTLHRTKK